MIFWRRWASGSDSTQILETRRYSSRTTTKCHHVSASFKGKLGSIVSSFFWQKWNRMNESLTQICRWMSGTFRLSSSVALPAMEELLLWQEYAPDESVRLLGGLSTSPFCSSFPFSFHCCSLWKRSDLFAGWRSKASAAETRRNVPVIPLRGLSCGVWN